MFGNIAKLSTVASLSVKGLGLVLLCLLAMGCDKELYSYVETIKYEVTGTASSVHITMHSASGNVEELNDISLPWSKEFEPNFYRDDDDYKVYSAYISAKNNGELGSVVVSIYRDGKVIQTATSSGAYVTATVSQKVHRFY
ncbi:MAG: hypothetical protein LBU89_07110 [Fibromonadaceae bacterium]|jgi:hypothetical protein|nr:hypothetical protein [Fibromonadaceae bacterium]